MRQQAFVFTGAFQSLLLVVFPTPPLVRPPSLTSAVIATSPAFIEALLGYSQHSNSFLTGGAVDLGLKHL